jgi:hypothetical protein
MSPLSMAILVIGCGFSQADSKTNNLLVRSKLEFEEGV